MYIFYCGIKQSLFHPMRRIILSFDLLAMARSCGGECRGCCCCRDDDALYCRACRLAPQPVLLLPPLLLLLPPPPPSSPLSLSISRTLTHSQPACFFSNAYKHTHTQTNQQCESFSLLFIIFRLTIASCPCECKSTRRIQS